MAGVLQNAPTRETLIYYSTSIFSAREEEGKDFVHEISLLEDNYSTGVGAFCKDSARRVQ